MTDVVGLLLLCALAQDRRPPRTNNDQGDVTRCNGVINGARKALPWRDVLDIHEDSLGSKQRVKVIA